MSLDKYKKMSEKEFKKLNKKELKEYFEFREKDFPRHHRRVEEITVETVLKPEEAIAIAKKYHEENKEEG
ncbi:hypothetical protein QCD85_22940, partial [Paenibacillus sp. PsM32]|nr:hypothetical protein [Paenibacillus sp. PsM32]